MQEQQQLWKNRHEELSSTLERERSTKEVELAELRQELEKSNTLWRTLKEENEKLASLSESAQKPEGAGARLVGAVEGWWGQNENMLELKAAIEERDAIIQDKEEETTRLR